MSQLNGYTVPDSVAAKTAPDTEETSRALIAAVSAALPVLRSDRDTLVRSYAILRNGIPDLSSIVEEGPREDLAEYDRAIALCEDALAKAGAR